MLALIDMELGNLQSVLKAFERVGARVTVTTRADDVERATAVVLPGVGAFGEGMAQLRRKGLVEPLREVVLRRNRPLLGICLGMQLLADEGEEHGLHPGLGLMPGRVMRLNPVGKGCRVPNIGWCPVRVVNRPSKIFGVVPDGESFYFAHSYGLVCADASDVVATFDYGEPVTAMVERGNLFGVQFHPEKSQDAGLSLLEAFHRHVRKTVGGDEA